MFRNKDDIRLPLLFLVLIVQAFLLLRLDWLTSPNRTEIGHIAASLRLYETGQFDLFHANPPLLRMLIGFIVTNMIHPQTDWSDYSPDSRKRSEWASGVSFIRANDFETVRQCFFLGRVIFIPLILLGGYFGYKFAGELFGGCCGFVFLILWTFSPFILGWGATICPDVTAASFGIIALYTFRHWLKKPTWVMSVLAGVTLGLLPLTKLTWIIAFIIFPVLWLLVSQKSFKNFGQLIIILIIGIFVLNLGYCFDGSFKRLGNYTFYSVSLTNENSVNKFSETWLGLIPVPLPEQFVLGFDTQRVDFEQGIPSYLLGQYSQHGWWYYYLVVLATKETLGTLILLGLAFILFFFARFRTTWQDEIILVVPFITIFVIVSSQTGFSLHSRYMIPALPFLYIWISRAGILLLSRFMFVRVIVPVILLFGTISSLLVYPYSMSYFNEAVGGSSQGHCYLLGSNIDWGQDLYELRDWLANHPESRPLYVSVSNIYPLETLDIRSAGTPPKWRPYQKPTGTWAQQLTVGPKPGWYLLGTNDLYNADHDYDWFHDLIPVKKIGYSIYIFHVTLEEANRLRKQYDLPMLIEGDFE
ncbi:MAG: glycosyltransferase family 39 protein [Planctomycetaceae bacterium]|jgi:hypothetical protein|nr:glycosyltransferase family 39 protein [Planctomycetaceae bacterium]